MRDHIEFGIDIRRKLSGADLYMRIFQIGSLLPLPYIFVATAHPAILGTRNLLSVLFDLGICLVPRAEAFGLSFLYRLTSSEVAVYFVLPVIALALGIVADRMLRGDPAASVRFHKTIAALITLDLAIRIIPVRANFSFGIPYAVAGLAVRAACLYMIIRDLKAVKK
jgi:hypothetical protein